MRLSPDQARAAAPSARAVRVVAGPGAGKTAVLAERYRRLVAEGTSPASILVMTFSERAAQEMRGRIAAAIGEEPAAVGTFHSLAMRWLREDGAAIGIHPAFAIEAGAERWIAVRELLWELGDPALVGDERPDALVTPLLKVQERLKQELIPLDRLEAWCAVSEDRERAALLAAAVRLFREHERRKRARLRLDFDDLLVLANRLFEERPPILARYHERFRHVMVDEYQDTNLAQERLVEQLGAGPQVSTYVVGDDDQSIYRFRGASLASMERFVLAFPGSETFRLGRNRRSPAAVVDTATALIGHNRERIPKELAATRAGGPAVSVLACADGASEAAEIARECGRLIAGGTPAESIAILCRTNAVARPLVDALGRAGVPARHWGALGLYALAPVRDAIALLRVLADPDDLVSLARLLDRLGGGIEPGVRVMKGAAGGALAALAGWRPAAGWAPALHAAVPLAAEMGAGDLFFEVMERTRYLERPGTGAEAVAAVTRLGELVQEFCERSPDQSLRAYLAWLDLVLLSGEEEDVPAPDAALETEAAVQVMTIHQAKGLEFEAVFVPALVEGRLPQPHRHQDLDLPQAVLEPSVRGREDHLAEERRLAYVAMTRARRRLYLTWAARYEGARAWRPSRFLAEAAAAGRTRERRVEPAPDAPAAPARAPRAPRERLTLSFSAIAAYRECPRQHWFRYRVGLPAAESVEGQYGTAVHAVLMRAGAARMRGETPGAAELGRALDEEWARTTFADPRRAPALHRLARRQLEDLARAGGLEALPVMVERSFTADLGAWSLRGVVDRVEEAGGGTRIVDYKTGSPLPASRLRRDLQLALYALGARTGLGLAEGPLGLRIVYLRDGRQVDVPVTEDLLQEARRAGDEVADGIAAGDFRPRPERRRCGLCAYRWACADAL